MREKKYSLLRNMIFHLESAKKWNKWVCYFQFLDVVPNMAATFLMIWLPSLIVWELQAQVSLKALVISIVAVSAGIMACNVADAGMTQYLYRNGLSQALYYDKIAFRKTMRIDYDLLESKAVQKLVSDVWNTLRSEFPIRESVVSMPVLIISALSTCLYGVLLCRISVVLMLVLALTIGINVLFLKKSGRAHDKLYEDVGRHGKAIAYINRHAMERSDGKDIRIYRMQDLFLGKYDAAVGQLDLIYGKICTQYFLRRAKELGLGFLTELFSYGYLAWLLTNGQLTVSEFVFSVGVVRTFSGNFSELIHKLQGLNGTNVFLTKIRTLLDLPEEEARERVNTDASKGVEIVFRNVSFRYPEAEEDVLKGIDLTVRSNEKLALIGLNGAGKTTLVKLLCGFYKPTKGEILINGIPQSKYPKEEYLALISVLFQDSYAFPVTVDENLTGSLRRKLDRERLEAVLDMSGFRDRYELLPQKGQTRMVREIHEDAIDLSGGEKQKLLFARALYKKAPLMILDEPTAALDPISENELYLRYGEAAKDRTAIFISHRLSSTRFCDRIVLLEDAHIVEEGTHDELIEKGGRYARLYEMQSRYYRKEGKQADEKSGF